MKSNRQYSYAKRSISSNKNRLGGTFSVGSKSPTCFTFLDAQNRCFLPFRGKEKTMNSFEIQGFTQIRFSL